ncbi:flagellar assembly protein FlbE [Brevundimonas balnearis]|uniref:Flagellar assembly protein FlbE n=1 Tax=Brevundimonas balnearis TaxID=1572858 RepID=A0ABV6R5W4_9CAUL
MTQAQPSTQTRPFVFDTEFSDTGAVLRSGAFTPTKRAYAPAEVEALVAQARAEARTAALAEADALRSQALATIAQVLTQSAGALQAAAERHRAGAADLALTAARVIAGAALTRFPHGPLKTALETLSDDVEASARLVVAASELDDAGRDEISRLCADAGFPGLVVFRDEPALPPAAFVLEWADGRAAYDPASAEARIRQALETALAADAGHAENLSQGDL